MAAFQSSVQQESHLSRPEQNFPSDIIQEPYSGPQESELARPDANIPTGIVQELPSQGKDQPPGYVPQPAPITSQPDPLYVTPLTALKEEPEWIDCPGCHARTRTRVQKNDSTATTLAGVLCCLVTCIGACVPCLCGWCQDIDHYCSVCGRQVTHQPHDGLVQVIAQEGQTAPGGRGVPSKYAIAGQ